MKRGCEETENENLNSSQCNYNTIIDMFAQGDKLLLITDKEKFIIFKEDLEAKVKMAARCFTLILIIQCILHGFLSYFNLKDCESKINFVNQSTKFSEISKDITYICASYVMHIFLIIGYFIIAFITTYIQSKILFQVFEIYIIIMFISDFFFSFVNPKNFYHVFENVINFLLMKYLKFLRDEVNKITV